MNRIPAPANPKQLVAFSLYAVFLAIFGAVIVEQVKHWAGKDFDPGPLSLICAVVFLGVNFAYNAKLRTWLQPRPTVRLTGERVASPSRGLMLLIGRREGDRQAAWAIRHHRDRLSHLWLIHSSDSEETAQLVRAQAEKNISGIRVRLLLLDNLGSVELAKDLVEQVRTEAQLAGLGWDDLICDFTGMTKPVSAGVVLANAHPGARMQYLEPTKNLADGRPDPDSPSRPIEVRLPYELERADPD